MKRDVPAAVTHQLRKEVNFGCPYPDCCSPILSWHHFDPPWNIENHHNPEGMIALCKEHHDFADGNNYTKEQLRKWKNEPNDIETIKYKVPWFWDNFIYEIGTSFWAPDAPITLNGKKILAAKKTDEDCPWELSICLLDENLNTIAEITDNCINAPTTLQDIQVTVQGKELRFDYIKSKNYIHLSCRSIKEPDLKKYLEKVYQNAYAGSKIKHPDGTIEIEAENKEKMKTMVDNLYDILMNYLTKDNELRILDVDGNTGNKFFTLSYTRAQQLFQNPNFALKAKLNWGFCKGNDVELYISPNKIHEQITDILCDSDKYKEIGDWQNVIKVLSQGLAIDKNNITFLDRLAFAYSSTQNHYESLQTANKMLEIDPNSQNAIYFRGRALLKMKKYELAIVDFEKMTSSLSKGEDVYLMLVTAYRELGKNKAIFECCQEFEQRFSSSPCAFFQLALALRDIEQYNDALRFFSKAKVDCFDTDLSNRIERNENNVRNILNS